MAEGALWAVRTFTDSGESMWRPSSWDISASVLYAPVAIMTAPICRGTGDWSAHVRCSPNTIPSSNCTQQHVHPAASRVGITLSHHVSEAPESVATLLWYMLRMARTSVALICSSTRRCDARSYTMMREKLPAERRTRMLRTPHGSTTLACTGRVAARFCHRARHAMPHPRPVHQCKHSPLDV